MLSEINNTNISDLRSYLKSLATVQEHEWLDEWSDKYRRLSEKQSAEGGPLNLDETPYNREILRCLSMQSPYDRVALMKGVRTGGSENAKTAFLYHIAKGRGTYLYTLPNKPLCTRFSNIEVTPLLEPDCHPHLQQFLIEKDRTDNVMEKTTKYGSFLLTYPSPGQMRQITGIWGTFDEIDDAKATIGANGTVEGHPVDLFNDRFNTAGKKRKKYYLSSPANWGFSKIYDLFMEGDQRSFHVHCPLCTKPQILNRSRLYWKNKFKNDPDFETVEYICSECDRGFKEKHKRKINLEGFWKAKNPGACGGKFASFQLPTIYAPSHWKSWTEIAMESQKAKINKDDILEQKLVQTIDGFPYRPRIIKPDHAKLYERRENFRQGIVPPGVLYLTCGVDLNQTFASVMVVGWTKNDKEAYIVLYEDVKRHYNDKTGIHNNDSMLDRIEKILLTDFKVIDSEFTMAIKMLGFDRGKWPEVVHEFCRYHPHNTFELRGDDSSDYIVSTPRKMTAYAEGKETRFGAEVRRVGTHYTKPYIYNSLMKSVRNDGSCPPGYIHFNSDLNQIFFKQLVSETFRTYRNKSGKVINEWKPHGRSEPLDCLGYALAALIVMGYEHFSRSEMENREADIWPNGYNKRIDRYVEGLKAANMVEKLSDPGVIKSRTSKKPAVKAPIPDSISESKEVSQASDEVQKFEPTFVKTRKKTKVKRRKYKVIT